MRLLPFLLAITLSALGVVAAYGDHIVHERRDILPDAWSEIARLGGQEVLPVRIGLAQSNLDKGHDLLMEISDPGSPAYGIHLAPDQVHDLFAPSGESVESVRAWLEFEGIAGDRVSQSVNKQWLQFDASVQEMERLLRAEYYLYSHADSGRSHIACREYHIPLSLQSHIDYITPGVKIQEVSAPSRKRSQKRDDVDIFPQPIAGTDVDLGDVLKDVLAYCDVVVTPACLRLMYNITQGTTAVPGNELGIFETLNDIYSQTDLNLFFSKLARHTPPPRPVQNDNPNPNSNIPNNTHPVHRLINGATAPAPPENPGPESALDFEVSYPVIWPQNSVLFQTDDPVYQRNNPFTGVFNNFLDAIDGSYCDASEESLDPPYPNPAPGGYKGSKQCGVYKPTNVISISYGVAESSLPIRYIRRQCNEWMKLGLQGVSVVIASGDRGVALDDDKWCLGENGTVFQPDFPAICPYLTAVGATTLPQGGDPYHPNEVASRAFASGGGFSNVFPQPWYQRSAVQEYFSRVNLSYPYYEGVDNSSFAQNGGLYNRIGRAYPDVSAFGENLLVFWNGSPTIGGGTSASAPIFAAMLTRINEERIAAGKPTVGFVNPLLYAHPEVFRDVVEGNNPGCKSDGFPAAPGWDPVTGLGSPRYDKMLELFMGV